MAGSDLGRYREPEPFSGRPLTGVLVLCGLLIAYMAVWTLYFAIADASIALHEDVAEAYAWGQEFQLGYYKHPPFWAWLAGTWFLVFPRTNWAFALLATLNAGLGLIGSWMLIGDFTSGYKRRAAAILLLLTPFYSFLAFKFNANTIFLSVWPWALHFFVRSIDRRRLGSAVGFGVLIGIALLCKYYAAILAVTCFVGALVHRDRAAYFRSPSPYVAIAAGLAVVAPHVWWMLRYGLQTIHYVASESGHGLGETTIHALRLPLSLLGMQAAVALVALWAGAVPPRQWPATFARRWGDNRFRFLVVLALLPVLLTMVSGEAIGFKVATNMMVGACSLFPLLIIEIMQPRDERALYRLGVRAAAALTAGALALSPAIAWARMRFSNDPAIAQPRQELAKVATRLWHAATGLPLTYVAGSMFYDNAVAFYGPDKAHVFIGFDTRKAPWVTPDDIARHGLLTVCLAVHTDCLVSTAAYSTPQTTQTSVTLRHTFHGYSNYPIAFVVTVIPPRS